MPEKKGLGRGLGALLGDAAVRESSPAGITLRMAEVEPNAGQPRKFFDDESLGALAESIRQHGVLTPLLVRRQTNGSYQIIAGERRWRAARMAGLTHIPVVITEADDRQATEIALIENLQREDLNPMEEAQGFSSLIRDYGLTQEDVAARVGRSRPAVANCLRLLSLPENLQKMVASGELSEGHARAVLGLNGTELQPKAVKQILTQELSVRQTEALVKKLTQESAELKKPRELSVNYLENHERQLSESLNRKVKIVSGKQKGRIELEFYGPDDFEALFSRLEKIR